MKNKQGKNIRPSNSIEKRNRAVSHKCQFSPYYKAKFQIFMIEKVYGAFIYEKKKT